MLTFSLILLLGYVPILEGGQGCPPVRCVDGKADALVRRGINSCPLNTCQWRTGASALPIWRSEEVARQVQGSNGLHHGKVFPNERRPLQENGPRLASEAWTQSIGSVDSTATSSRTLNTWRRWVLPVGVTVGVGTVVFLLYSLRGR
jgi:hypothetical protein